MRLRALILDLDGTLLDSLGAYELCLGEILGALGLPRVSSREVRELLRAEGPPWRRLVPPELWKRCLELDRELWPRVFPRAARAMAGARRLLRWCRARGVKVGVVTSSWGPELEEVLRREGLWGMIQAMVTAEDTPERKPSPLPLRLCLRRLGVRAREALYVGDSVLDVRMAQAAGVPCLAALTGVGKREELERAGAAVVSDLEELLRLMEGAGRGEILG